ncbi:hypothetical protein ACP8Y2_17595 [Herpetosiphon llansteffanensis]
MYCPKCYIKFPSGERRCPKCGGPGVPRNTPLKVNSVQPKTVNLTGRQKSKLLFSSVMGLLFLAIPSIIIFGILLPMQFNWLMFVLGISIISLGIYKIPSLHELIDGNSYIKSAQLIRVDRFQYSSVSCFGFFKDLGCLRIDNEMFEKAKLGAIYQINYSPRSKIAWSMKIEYEQPVSIISDIKPNVQESIGNKTRKITFIQRKELLFMLMKHIVFTSLYPIYIIFNPTIDLSHLNVFIIIIYVFMLYNLGMIILAILDLISNTNELDDDRLIRVKFIYDRRGKHFYAIFEGNNRLNINEQQYINLIESQIYQITYSRWTRKLWEAQLIDS